MPKYRLTRPQMNDLNITTHNRQGHYVQAENNQEAILKIAKQCPDTYFDLEEWDNPDMPVLPQRWHREGHKICYRPIDDVIEYLTAIKNKQELIENPDSHMICTINDAIHALENVPREI